MIDNEYVYINQVLVLIYTEISHNEKKLKLLDFNYFSRNKVYFEWRWNKNP